MSKGFNLISSNPNQRSAYSQDTLRKQLGTPSTTDPKARPLLPRMELDEVIVPSLNLESSTSEKSVPVMPTPTREEANDHDHETSYQVNCWTSQVEQSTFRTRVVRESCPGSHVTRPWQTYELYATSCACVGFSLEDERVMQQSRVSISLSFENQGINPVG